MPAAGSRRAEETDGRFGWIASGDGGGAASAAGYAAGSGSACAVAAGTAAAGPGHATAAARRRHEDANRPNERGNDGIAAGEQRHGGRHAVVSGGLGPARG